MTKTLVQKGVLGPPFAVARFSKALVALKDLPKPDIVLIAHDHYDHLDAQVMREFAEQDAQPQFLVPLGLSSRLKSWGSSWLFMIGESRSKKSAKWPNAIIWLSGVLNRVNCFVLRLHHRPRSGGEFIPTL